MFAPEVFFGLGALALLAVLIWGSVQYRRRNRTHSPGAYTTEQERYRAQIRPS